MKGLLQKGNEFSISRGMRVYHSMPGHFVFGNSAETTPRETDVTVGDVMKSGFEDTMKYAAKRIIESLCHCTLKEPLTEAAAEKMVRQLAQEPAEKTLDTSYLVGDYRVTKTLYSGGGSQMTMSGHPDDYPDGWRVYAEKIEDPSVKINFYQSGAFTAMIRPEQLSVN